MPTASSTEIIASATCGILHALNNPTTGSPLGPMTDTETETLKQLTSLLHNKTTEPNLESNNNNNHGTDLRVPPQTAAEPPTQATEPKEPNDNTYQHSTRYKKRQTNKHKRRGTLAATQDTVIATAHYAKQILQKEETTAYDPAEYFCCYAIHPDTGLPAEYKDLRNSSEGAEWIIETADEVGRLAQGNNDTGIKGTDTMFFIHRSEIPQDRKPTYLCIVAAD